VFGGLVHAKLEKAASTQDLNLRRSCKMAFSRIYVKTGLGVRSLVLHYYGTVRFNDRLCTCTILRFYRSFHRPTIVSSRSVQERGVVLVSTTLLVGKFADDQTWESGKQDVPRGVAERLPTQINPAGWVVSRLCTALFYISPPDHSDHFRCRMVHPFSWITARRKKLLLSFFSGN
jgi:hypothetical protein